MNVGVPKALTSPTAGTKVCPLVRHNATTNTVLFPLRGATRGDPEVCQTERCIATYYIFEVHYF